MNIRIVSFVLAVLGVVSLNTPASASNFARPMPTVSLTAPAPQADAEEDDTTDISTEDETTVLPQEEEETAGGAEAPEASDTEDSSETEDAGTGKEAADTEDTDAAADTEAEAKADADVTAEAAVDAEADAAEEAEDAEAAAETAEEEIADADVPLAEEAPAEPVYTSKVYLNGQPMPDGTYYFENGTTYVTIAGAMAILEPTASVAQSNGVVTVSGGTKVGETTYSLSIRAAAGIQYIEANERALYVPDGNPTLDGKVAMQARTLAQIFNLNAVWDSATGIVFIDKIPDSAPYFPSGDQFYNADDLFLMSHIIYAESGNQPLAGKIAVGNVIMNRVKSPQFPNNIHDVIYQKNQFAPTANGKLKKTPNKESVIAAKLAMEGAVVLKNAIFFNVKGMSTWASKHKTYVATIGNHDFYG